MSFKIDRKLIIKSGYIHGFVHGSKSEVNFEDMVGITEREAQSIESRIEKLERVREAAKVYLKIERLDGRECECNDCSFCNLNTALDACEVKGE